MEEITVWTWTKQVYLTLTEDEYTKAKNKLLR